MPHLDIRLKTVAKQIQADCHADIGSDHGNLLVALLKTGRIKSAIAVENKRLPFENSQKALKGLRGEARLADGLNGIAAGEVDSLSICGMGGRSMVTIMESHPDRIPSRFVLQPNRDEDRVRRWAMQNGFHLVEEHLAWNRRPYTVLTYRSASGTDPAYVEMDDEAAFMFGPINIRRREPAFVDQLIKEYQYLCRLTRLNDSSHKRFALIASILDQYKIDASRHSISDSKWDS